MTLAHLLNSLIKVKYYNRYWSAHLLGL